MKIVLTALVALVLAGAAASGTKPKPQPTYNYVDSGTTVAYYEDVEVDEGFSYAAYPVYCRARKAVRVARSLVGLWLYRYWQRISWCYNFHRITAIHRTRHGEVNNVIANPWEFYGHVGSNCNFETCSDRAGGTSAYITTQGRFHACWGWIWNCDDRVPGIWQVVTANGGYSSGKF